jgi:hypothetical protein|tara:strand:- start:3062 stop:3715 length:654 start_codon:yes stop_codon:yes gene_type:complete
LLAGQNVLLYHNSTEKGTHMQGASVKKQTNTKRPRKGYSRISQAKPHSEGGLVSKQEAFARLVVENPDWIQAKCAEEAGYPVAGASSMATKLLNPQHSPRVVARIEELRKEYQKQFECTFENHVMKLAEIRDIALANGQYAPAVTAEKARGSVAGLYIERKEILHGRIDQMSRVDVLKEIESLQKQYPFLQAVVAGNTLIEGEILDNETGEQVLEKD